MKSDIRFFRLIWCEAWIACDQKQDPLNHRKSHSTLSARATSFTSKTKVQRSKTKLNHWHLLFFKRGARLRWQSQPRQHGGNPVAWNLAGNLRAGFGRHGNFKILFHVNLAHVYSTGMTNSLARTMFSFARAAVSMARGSVRNLSISDLSVWLTLRNASTSVCITEYCSAATRTSVRVRMFTVTQTASVARRTIPKTTHDGIIPPLRRISVLVPIKSIDICCIDPREAARGITRCALILSSTQ